MHYWLVSIFEQTPVDKVTDTRFQCIARELLRRGHTVTFFASTFKHNTKNQRYSETTVISVEEGFTMVYIKSAAYRKNISVRRMSAHWQFARDAVSAFPEYEKPDRILVAFPPISLAFSTAIWARSQKIPVFIDIIDPWPDIFRKPLRSLPAFVQNALLFPMERKVRTLFKTVDGVTAISRQYIDWARKYNSELYPADCFYPAVDFEGMQRQLKEAAQSGLKDESPFCVIYAGSLASSYDIPAILQAAGWLERKYGQAIRFLIAGAGPQAESIKEYEQAHGNLVYLGRLSKQELMRQYYLSDAGLTQHIKGASQSVTYKLFDLLACGLPIFNSLESEMKDIILDNQVGFFNEPGNGIQLAENIERLYLDKGLQQRYRDNALRLTRSQGDSRVVYGRLVDFFLGSTNSASRVSAD
jgi:glycosyltransferase involved in cell wall biosynthesis